MPSAFPSNIINGTAGNDILVGSTPDEIINSGPGNDSLKVAAATIF